MASKADSFFNKSCITNILLVILIVLNIWGLYLLMGNTVSFPSSLAMNPIGIKKALLEMEYQKVGGKANYDVVNQATLIQIKDQLPQMQQYIKTQWWKVDDAQANEPVVTTSLSTDEINAILSGASIEGNKWADIIAIEYSDMECPFCIKQYSDTKLQASLATQYGDKVAFVFKNSRWVNHPGTEAKAIGALCAKRVGWDKAYIAFYHAIMDGTTQSAVYPVDKLGDIAKNIKIDLEKWNACVSSKATLALFDAEGEEAKKYGMAGTPWTLLLNVKTGKYAIVEWAYPFSEFVQKIASIQ